MSTREASVLYDLPGPRTRRNILIGSIVFAILAILGLYQFVYVPLEENGQFSEELWGPLIDPSNENFNQVWQRIGEGFQNTLIAAAMAIVSSVVMGTALAILRFRLYELAHGPRGATRGRRSLLGLGWVLNLISKVFVEFFRGLPVLITIYFVSRALPEYGVNLSTRAYLVIGLTLYNMVVIGEILRSGMANLPRGQKEAADAVGLSGMQTIISILLPQAFRIMLPALISQVVVVLKDTSLGFIIGYEEALRVGGQIIQVLGNPIQVYTVIGAIYIAINYAVSKLAQYMQRRIARGRKTPPGAHVPDTTVPSLHGGATDDALAERTPPR
jgi:glutamate transport system permease protein